MGFEDDFVNEETVTLDVEGRSFVYKPTTAGEENEWSNSCLYRDEEGVLKQDYAKNNELKLKNNIRGTPYTPEQVEKLIGVKKDFKDLDPDQRWQVLQKLRSDVFNKLIIAINDYDTGGKKKVSSEKSAKEPTS